MPVNSSNKKSLNAVIAVSAVMPSGLDEMGVNSVVGGTWCTDGFYRETRTRAEQVKAQGCIAGVRNGVSVSAPQMPNATKFSTPSMPTSSIAIAAAGAPTGLLYTSTCLPSRSIAYTGRSVSIGDKQITSLLSYNNALATLKPDDEVQVTVYRGKVGRG